ncbi:hypothetical protein DQ04_18211010 [Trypanosoma grayi]|uniref:hypothetical protein n=1 Tax=Trypanosoma grayi TaxID=71804 RepID=UPI0004F408A5|nr:hypothetical protein DQ04_18211010 [Trypanosoma grayi]KEG05815.1 hypothetical protein DQ04_18211010 [Trypanosoma grayi]
MLRGDGGLSECSGSDCAPSSRASSVGDVPLPPLPPPTPPPDVDGMAADGIYSIIKELRRQIEDPATQQDIRAMLKRDPSVLRAVARVLHESSLLRRAVVSANGQVGEQVVPLPEAPPPPLPSGCHGWA